MKKQIVMVLLLIICTLSISAQKVKDVLYLKNGSIIFGKLIEISEAQYKIQTSDGSMLIYSNEEVQKFAREAPGFEGRKKSGFTYSLEAGLLAGSQDTKYFAPFSFNILAGGTVMTKNIISAGTGVEFIGRPYTPLFIEYKYIINDKKTSPFVFLRGGAVLALGGAETSNPNYNDYGPKDYKGGGSVTFGTGISWAKDDYETFLSFAYRYAHTSYTQKEYAHGDVTYSENLNRLEIKFGFKF